LLGVATALRAIDAIASTDANNCNNRAALEKTVERIK